MRWFWSATLTFLCGLLAVLYRQPLILLAELLIIDLFITRKFPGLARLAAWFKQFPAWISFMFWLLLTVLALRVLVFDSLTVDHSGGSPVVRPGDCVLVSKLHYGPRLPMTPLGLPFSRQYLPFTTCSRSYLGKPQFPYHRLPGFSAIKQGDLVCFNYPQGDTILCGSEPADYYAVGRTLAGVADLPAQRILYHPVDRRSAEISRCIGLPGDTVRIRAGSVTTFIPGSDTSNQTVAGDYNVFPHDPAFPWTASDFGPIIVPAKGDSVRLTVKNLPLYRRIIEASEGRKVQTDGDRVLIDGVQAETYTFDQNYYFVIGDNRRQSRDSRHWGFLPESHIIGKPLLIWFSTCSSDCFLGINWKRICNVL